MDKQTVKWHLSFCIFLTKYVQKHKNRRGYQAAKVSNLLHFINLKGGNVSCLWYHMMWHPQVSWAFENIMKRRPVNSGYGEHQHFMFTEIYELWFHIKIKIAVPRLESINIFTLITPALNLGREIHFFKIMQVIARDLHRKRKSI